MITPQGGTEILTKQLMQHLGSWPEQLNLIISMCDAQLLHAHKKNIMWQHLDVDQPAVQAAHDATFRSQIHHWIFVSEWQRSQYLTHFGLDPIKTSVIHNAIPHIPWQPKPQMPMLKMIYTSTPWRGLHILLQALELLQNVNWHLTVYSSTIIYGKQFSDHEQHKYAQLFDVCRAHDRIKYVGYGTHTGVLRALQHSHAWVYPCVFRETSCVAALEAAAAGCAVITTSLGALPETLGMHATFLDNTLCATDLVMKTSQAIQKLAHDYQADDPRWRHQAHEFDKHHTWSTRITTWKQLIQYLLDES